jgi:UDP-N-acetylglucosamine acyltransferase
MALSVTSHLIHPTAIIGPDVELAPDVQVGPYCILSGSIKIGPGCTIESHVCLEGPLEMGRDNYVAPGAILGKMPQSRAYKGEPTRLRIGNGNIFREYVTIHRGTVDGGYETLIGDHNYFMTGSHIGHDSHVGNGCTLANGALVAGHCHLGDGCILSGHSAIQQRVRVGRLAMIGGLGSSTKDVPPFVLQQGYNCVSGLNLVGLRRAGVHTSHIDALRQVFRILYKEGRALHDAVERIESDYRDIPVVTEFISFIRDSKIGINPARSSNRKHRTY